MTALPDWLVERAVLDEVPPASRERVDRADPHELAERIAALRADNAAELAAHPAAVAVAQIESRIAEEARRRAVDRRRSRLRTFGILSAAAAALVVVVFVTKARPSEEHIADASGSQGEVTRVKGAARLLVFRQVGERAERLEQDALVRAGDLIQRRYNAGGHGYGVIASIDGAGAVTLHHPATEDAPPEATALAARTTALPHAYELDDAPRFERFFFITADAPVDVQQSLASLRALARRSDSATTTLSVPQGVRQWSVRLRKPDLSTPNHQAPTP